MMSNKNLKGEYNKSLCVNLLNRNFVSHEFLKLHLRNYDNSIDMYHKIWKDIFNLNGCYILSILIFDFFENIYLIFLSRVKDIAV